MYRLWLLRFVTCLGRNYHSVNVYSQYVYVTSVILLFFVQTTQILQFSVINVLEIFGGVCSNLSSISPNVSSVRTWRRRFTFLFFTEPVFLNLLACLLIVLGLGTGRPGNFTRNLHCVSEHDVLLFIYVLWIYTRSRNENSCVGMSQIAIITITTLTAIMSNNNHNQ